MGSGSPKSTTTTTKQDPWEGQQPFLTGGFSNIADIFGLSTTKDSKGKITGVTGTIDPNALPAYYPKSTIAADSPETKAALAARSARATQGSPLVDTAQGEVMKTLRGDYLNSNPYIDATYNKAARGVTQNFNEVLNPGIDSAFTRGGRFGSGAYASARNQSDRSLGNALGDMATGIYGQNYANERQNQLASQGFVPGLAEQDYKDINQLASVGDYNTNLAQQKIDADRAKHDYNASKKLNALKTYQDLISGNYGGTTTQNNPYFRNSAGGALGTIGQIAGIAGSLWGMSDVRLKENIIPLGKENGHNIYEFNYKGDPSRYVGVIAQEVRKVHPDAVMETPIGYAVNYDAIGVKMRKVG